MLLRRVVLLAIVLGAAALFAWTVLEGRRGGEVGARAVAYPALAADITGFERAIGPYEWRFPEDHGPHHGFQTEWWYYTGNLATEEGRRFGYQFTIFRRAITPDTPDSESEWRTNQLYLAHFTVTDVARAAFHQSQRLSRASAGLAGATADPVYRIWLEDWEATALDADAQQLRITAAMDGAAIDLTLTQAKPPALQGEGGLSPKSDEPGNASYYYTLSRLETNGTITVGGEDYAVTGSSWMDHEFSTSALGADAVGWDWFGLHLDDGTELMLGQIRLEGGGIDPVFGGLYVRADGSTHALAADDFTIEATGTWTSPHTGATYPAGWHLSVDVGQAAPLELSLEPLVADQELTEGISYWEGAVRITGDVTGYGYAELTGYTSPMRGRF